MLVPGRLPPDVVDRAAALGRRVADIVGAVGVLAVELFWSDGVLMVNEIAARPHNSGHWTIEGAVTSQFENHLRAVLDLPLGSTAPQHAEVANVNVFGGPEGTDPVALLPFGLAVEGAHVHLYGKEARPGRKLGHVTVCGDDADDVRGRAWAAALGPGHPGRGRRRDDHHAGQPTGPLVGVVMGSSSDLEVMHDAVAVLDQFGLPHEVRVVSAHRTPDDMVAYGHAAAARGLKVLIAGAGGAAHLPGMLAAVTPLARDRGSRRPGPTGRTRFAPLHRPDAPGRPRGHRGHQRGHERGAAGGPYPGDR